VGVGCPKKNNQNQPVRFLIRIGVVKMLMIVGKAIAVAKTTGKTVSLNGLFLHKL